MKKSILYVCSLAASLAACTDDYTDWAEPQQAEPESPFSVSFSAASVSPIDLAEVATDSVTVFTPTLTTDAVGASATYRVDIDDTHSLAAGPQGQVSTADLSAAVVDIYGRRPTERVLNATVHAYVNVSGTSVKPSDTPAIEIRVTPQAPVIENVYYVIGNVNGWQLDSTYPMTNGDVDVYDNPVFTITIPAPTGEDGSRIALEFKVAPQSAIDSNSWDNVWGCTVSDETLLSGELQQGDGSQNLVQSAADGALYYTISVNMLDATYTISPLSFRPYLYMPGNQNGWNHDTCEALYSPASDGVYTGYAWMDGGFKFTPERNWNNGEYNYESFSTMSDCFSLVEGTNINISPAGFYQIRADIPSATLTATLIENVGLCGGFNGWDTASAPLLTYDAAAGCWTGTAEMSAGEFKFITNGGWAINFGGTTDNLVEDGANLYLDEGGTYVISLYLSRSSSSNMYCTVVKQ